MASHDSSEVRFAAYVAALVDIIGHADRATPLRDYCTGLLMPAARKSVEPMAAMTAPARVAAQHQSLLHFVGQAPWSDAAVLTKVRDLVLPAIEGTGPIEAWIIDDTGFPKKGRHSVGVDRQYCGQIGKQDNCQIAVTLSLANAQASLPIAYRLYLPEAWAQDAVRRSKAGVPQEIGFQTKPEIALDQIRAALADQMPPGLILADSTGGIPFAVLIIRAFMGNIPREVVEAARVDGAGHVRAFVSVVLPCARGATIRQGPALPVGSAAV